MEREVAPIARGVKSADKWPRLRLVIERRRYGRQFAMLAWWRNVR
jgi:hypothetical protein